MQLSGYGNYDIFVAKYDPNGKCLWVNQAGGTLNDYGRGISVDNNGNIYVTGDFINTVAFGSIQLISYGYEDIFLAKYDSNGNCQWVKQSGGVWGEEGYRMSIDAKGTVPKYPLSR